MAPPGIDSALFSGLKLGLSAGPPASQREEKPLRADSTQASALTQPGAAAATVGPTLPHAWSSSAPPWTLSLEREPEGIMGGLKPPPPLAKTELPRKVSLAP